MAGSSVPLAQRIPPLDLPAGAELVEAVSTHGGPVESYDFHGLEVLQSLAEFRRGGETGVSRVEFLERDALLKAADEGRWSRDLLQAALRAETAHRPGLTDRDRTRDAAPSHGILLTYKDGFRGTVLRITGGGERWNFACHVKGEAQPRATTFFPGPWGNRNLFRALSHAIQHMFVTGDVPYPVERTLLVTGILPASLESRRDGKPVDTPHLEFAYQPRDFTAMREMGDSWKIIHPDTPRPPRFEPGDEDTLKVIKR
jgi:hypothetical protein